MCIFSGPVQSVSGTSIFVKDRGNGLHACVYEMTVGLTEPVAMVLPVPSHSDDDALQFIDLSGFPDFFQVIDDLFPAEERGKFLGARKKNRSDLKVHDVGNYEASYVPSIGDFHRLDERFRLQDGVWDQLPNYNDFGFAVFQLKVDDEAVLKYHPMAFEYPPNDPDRLFFPTVHIHDGGDVPSVAEFDHSLYLQAGGRFRLGVHGWTRSTNAPQSRVFNKSHGLVTNGKQLFRLKIDGTHPNQDLMIKTDGLTTHKGREPAAETTTAVAVETRHCTNCGAAREPEHKFCGHCGTKL